MSPVTSPQIPQDRSCHQRTAFLRYSSAMIFEQIRHGGCLSYLIGCEVTRHALLVDPELDEADRYLALAAEKGVRIRRIVDTHTHADHFTAARELGRSSTLPSSCTVAAPRRSSICASRTATR